MANERKQFCIECRKETKYHIQGMSLDEINEEIRLTREEINE